MQTVDRSEILQSHETAGVVISELSEQYLECLAFVVKILNISACFARSAHSYVFGLRAIGYTGPLQCVISDLVRDPAVHAGFNVGSGILVRGLVLQRGYNVGYMSSYELGMSTRNLEHGLAHPATSPVGGC